MLKEFVKSLMEALKELHGLGQAHYDVLLPNICFNEIYEAVLIDVDMWKKSGEVIKGAVYIKFPKVKLKSNLRNRVYPMGPKI